MNSLGIYEIELQIKGKTFEHHINLINQLSHNIIEISFSLDHARNEVALMWIAIKNKEKLRCELGPS